MAPLPAIKIFAVLLRLIRTPIKNYVVTWGRSNEKLLQLVERLGQEYHLRSTQLTVMSSGYRVLSIKPLPEEEAVNSGAEMVADAVLITITLGIVYIEYNRGEQAKIHAKEVEAAKEAEFQAFLAEKFAALEQGLQEAQERLDALDGGKKRKTKKQKDGTHSDGSAPATYYYVPSVIGNWLFGSLSAGANSSSSSSTPPAAATASGRVKGLGGAGNGTNTQQRADTDTAISPMMAGLVATTTTTTTVGAAAGDGGAESANVSNNSNCSNSSCGSGSGNHSRVKSGENSGGDIIGVSEINVSSNP